MIFSGNTKEVVTSMKEQPLIISLFVIFLSLRILLLFGLFASVTEFKKHWMLWLVLVYFLAISGPVGAARFFLPVSVVFVVLSALGWSKILAFFKKSPKS
jgi:asparagine N-glycosylation enzyme membrane subunit Stt3